MNLRGEPLVWFYSGKKKNGSDQRRGIINHRTSELKRAIAVMRTAEFQKDDTEIPEGDVFSLNRTQSVALLPSEFKPSDFSLSTGGGRSWWD